MRGISFVGSTPIARYVYETGTSNGKRVQALGGAKNHMVVLPDADLDLAADAAVSAGFGSAGERCMAVSVVVAVDPVGDELVEPRSASGSPTCTSATAAGRAARWARWSRPPTATRSRPTWTRASAEGATLVGGRPRPRDRRRRTAGFWLGPTLFDHVRPDMSIYTDEIFGPVLSVVRADTYEYGGRR